MYPYRVLIHTPPKTTACHVQNRNRPPCPQRCPTHTTEPLLQGGHCPCGGDTMPTRTLPGHPKCPLPPAQPTTGWPSASLSGPCAWPRWARHLSGPCDAPLGGQPGQFPGTPTEKGVTVTSPGLQIGGCQGLSAGLAASALAPRPGTPEPCPAACGLPGGGPAQSPGLLHRLTGAWARSRDSGSLC